MLWSREPWSEEEHGEQPGMPGGRLVTGITSGLRVVGVCIPWHMAHVTTGRRDRKPWQDHLSYLEFLRPMLESFLERPEPVVVLGDWNQPIPRPSWHSRLAYEALMETVPPQLHIASAGPFAGIDEALIDHLAVGAGLEVQGFEFIDRRNAEDRPLSDHIGYTAEITHKAKS